MPRCARLIWRGVVLWMRILATVGDAIFRNQVVKILLQAGFSRCIFFRSIGGSTTRNSAWVDFYPIVPGPSWAENASLQSVRSAPPC